MNSGPNVVDIEELKASLRVPSVYSNRFYMSITPGGLRLTFAEAFPGVKEVEPRFSVLLPYGDAFQLRDVLSDMLGKHVVISDPVAGNTTSQSGSQDEDR